MIRATERLEDDSSGDTDLGRRCVTEDTRDKTVTTAVNQFLDSIAEEQKASEQFEDRLNKLLNPKTPDDLFVTTSDDAYDITPMFGDVTSLLSSPVFTMPLMTKLDRRQGGDIGRKCFPPQSLAANIEELNHSVKSQKAADSLFETKLRLYMNEDLLW